jgi:tripartite-type tricarboxylate transporter receptor subunit TctC
MAKPQPNRPRRRHTLAACLAAAMTMLPMPAAQAQTYPERPLKLIVPFPPGGNTDVVARMFGQKLSEALGQPVVVDNRGGAAGSIGVTAAAKSPPDGYTLVIGDIGTLGINRFAYPKLPYDPLKDFAPISLLATVSIVMTARPDFPANTFQEFLAVARANPGKFSYASNGAGGVGHLSFEMLRSMAKIDLSHVPYKGGAPAVADLMGGHVDVLIDGAAYAQVKAGKLKALAMTGQRIPSLPDVPSISEAGVPGYSFTNWWGFLTPAGTDPKIVQRLSTEVQRIAAMPEIRDRLVDAGISAGGSTPEAFAALIRNENDKIGRIVKDAAIRFQ